VIFIESMAQPLGWLIIHTHDFRLSAVMSLIEDVKVAPDLRPGFSAEISGQLISTSRSDSLGSAQMRIDGREIASIGRIIYVHSAKADQDALRRMFRYYGGWQE
jgi:3-hydroxyacyl-[acyl-carrier-protein] dehydratase